MTPTLQELLDHGLLTQDEVTELECYLSCSPETWLAAPLHLQDKVWMGVALLDLEPGDETRH